MIQPMSDPGAGDMEARLTVLEREVAQLRDQLSTVRADVTTARTDSGAARVLAAGADHDVTEVRAELRAHTQALNALRETQLDHHGEVQELRTEVRQGFATLKAGQEQITALLERIAGPGDTSS
jgi:chromosome segregation ATPase